MKVCIIGSGIASNATVDELAKHGNNIEIFVFTSERFLPYNKIYILDVLSGKKTFSQIALKNWQWYEENGVKILLDTKIGKIYTKNKTFISNRGELFSYDKLVLATGSSPRIPSIDGIFNKDGVFKKNIFVIRNIDDIYKILDYARLSKKAIVIGGGFIGIEGAMALKDIGLQVTLVHALDTLMESWLDKEASDMLIRDLNKSGISVLLSRNTIRLHGDKNVYKVEFANGDELETDFVVLATGIMPNVELAKNSGLRINKGIIVNEYLETSEIDVYAVGECIEFQGKIFGLVSPIMEQAKVCAVNVVNGNTKKYSLQYPEYTILKLSNISVVSIGNINDKSSEEIVYKNSLKNVYKKVLIRDGLITGAVLYNTLNFSDIIKLVQSRVNILDKSPDFLIEDLIEKPAKREFEPSELVCKCNSVSYQDILKAIENGAKTIEDIQKLTKASTSCGGCMVDVEMILSSKAKEQPPKKLNKVEDYKLKTHPLDWNLYEKLEYWINNGGVEAISEEDKDIGLKWHGIFYRKATPGYFMVRIRIPHGKLSSEQAKIIAILSERFGRGEIDLTSREQIQLRWLTLEHLIEVIQALNTVGLSTLQTGMDNIRNVTGDPLSGLAEDSLIDTIPIAKNITQVFLGNKKYANFPRKLNFAILGSRHDSINCKYNDICFYLARKNKHYGFNLYLGGKIGSGGPEEALDINTFVMPHEVVDVSKALFDIYIEYGNRENRSKNRLYFLLKNFGINAFKLEIEKRILRNLDSRGEDIVDKDGERDILVRQKNGLYSVLLVPPVGMFDAGDLYKLAILSRKYGSGELRLTVYQNIYIINVPQEHLSELLADELFVKYQQYANDVFKNTIACQGSRTCSFGVIENKSDAINVAHKILDDIKRPKDVRMHWSGCAKGCGQHGAGDIGFAGTKVKVNNEVKLGVDIYIKNKKVNTTPLENVYFTVKSILSGDRDTHHG
jgi:nitrite reductase (NADH) large subunit